MTNNADGINTDIGVCCEKLETVSSFKYLGTVDSDERSRLEILSRIAQTGAAMAKLRPIWNDRDALTGNLKTCIYVCELWTLTGKLERRIRTTEMKCYRRPLGISYKDHITNAEVRNKITTVAPDEDLLATVNKRKLAKTILQGTVQGKRKRGRQRRRWEDNSTEWTGKALVP